MAYRLAEQLVGRDSPGVWNKLLDRQLVLDAFSIEYGPYVQHTEWLTILMTTKIST